MVQTKIVAASILSLSAQDDRLFESRLILCRSFRNQLHYRAVSPTVFFLARDSAIARCNSGSVSGEIERGLGRRNVSTGNPHLRFWIGAQILHPVRGRILRDHKEASVAMREPDLDFARLSALATAGGQIQILLLVEVIVL